MKAEDCLGWVSWGPPTVIPQCQSQCEYWSGAQYFITRDKTQSKPWSCVVFQVDGTILVRLLIYVRMSQSGLLPAVRLRSSLKLIFSRDIGQLWSRLTPVNTTPVFARPEKTIKLELWSHNFIGEHWSQTTEERRGNIIGTTSGSLQREAL